MPDLPEELLNAKIRFWMCPEHKGWPGDPDRGRVEWRDGIAYCLTKGCTESSRKTGA